MFIENIVQIPAINQIIIKRKKLLFIAVKLTINFTGDLITNLTVLNLIASLFDSKAVNQVKSSTQPTIIDHQLW